MLGVASDGRRPTLASAPAPAKAWERSAGGVLPTYSLAEVATHTTVEKGVWVTFRGGVYDITTFVQNHPGGVDKIMTAAGQSVEPFWSLYRQHLQPKSTAADGPVPKDHVAEILAPLQVGWLDPAEMARQKRSAADDNDPYAHEPERHPALKLISATPCSGESPATLMSDSWTTPNDLFFVRNHHPVPVLDDQTFTLEVSSLGGNVRSFTLAELRALPQATVTASLQCGGNRRGELNSVRKTSGNAWGLGAISNATWTGVRLVDVLAAAGAPSDEETAEAAGVGHVELEGVDGTTASIPVGKATSRSGDVLLAYEMNGEPLPPDHGFPLRAVVPGYVGVRNIKWLRRVSAQEEEAHGVWQRGIAYKMLGPDVTSADGVDLSKVAPVNELPVTSAILVPQPDAKVAAAIDEGAPASTVEVKGFAWSGGGRGIVRVDVSADDGATWHTATLGDGSEQPRHKAWAWTFWEADVPLPAAVAAKGATKLVCKAVDASHNTQPESVAAVWNLRGLANNAWHRVPISVVPEE